VVQVFTFLPTPLQTSGLSALSLKDAVLLKSIHMPYFLAYNSMIHFKLVNLLGTEGVDMIAICSCQYQAKGAASRGWSSYHDKHAGQI